MKKILSFLGGWLCLHAPRTSRPGLKPAKSEGRSTPTAEHFPKEALHIHRTSRLRSSGSGPGMPEPPSRPPRCRAGAKTGMTKAIVGFSFFNIGKHFIRFGDFRKAPVSFRGFVHVGVIFARELAIRFAQLRNGGIAFDSEQLIIILASRHQGQFAIGNRSIAAGPLASETSCPGQFI